MFLDKLIKSIGLFFTGLFNATKKAWAKEDPIIKASIENASGIVHTINTYVTNTPEFVLDILKKQFPAIDIEKIKESLQAASKYLGIAGGDNDADILVVIANLQKHLSETANESDTAWAKASHAAYLAIAVILAPIGTKLAKFVLFAEYVYHDIIKGGK